MRHLMALPLALGLAAAGGCGPRQYPVTGTVTLENGSPLTKGLLVFESRDKAHTARGNVGPDGRYELSTLKQGDGVFPGPYRVLVNPIDLSDVPDEQKVLPFDAKYLKFDTSGLEFEVAAGTNDIPIKLDRPSRRK